MKKQFLGVVVGSLLLSGCSLGGVPVSLTGNENSATSSEISAFAIKSVSGSLWKTEDSGKTFMVKSQVDAKSSITKADILSIAYHPQKSGMIYVGTVDSGIFKTENGGDQWTPIAFPPKRIYSFILDKNDPDNRMFASGMVGEWGKIFRTDDGGTTWRDVYTEPGQKIPITALSQHFRERNIIFAGTAAGTVVKSVDSGETWANVGNEINGTVSDIAFDSTKSLVTYLLVFGQKVYYSSDGGVQWIDWEVEKQKEMADLQDRASRVSSKGNRSEGDSIRNQVTNLSKRNQENEMPRGIVSIASDPTQSGVLYAGTNVGLFRSTDFGKYWEEINIIESAKAFPIRSIAVNPQDSEEIVFVAGKAFYKSIDGGVTWMTTGLNVDRGVSFITYDPFDPKYLFIGLRNFK
ncbi:MAG: hypothetical protein AUK19_03680 [Candidatus Moranbacteria bacterium CG2_30_45_14]|nr:MAG: hypothetical protein AUK19_03680 [Candidatus Moranbacteria bacterium CG2_30_45_14]